MKGQRRLIPQYVKVVVGTTLVAVGGLVATHIDTVPQTGRKRVMFLNREMERELGDQTFKAILAEHAGRILPPTHPKAKMVKYVGQRIANAAKQNDFKWEFVTIDSPEANAFCIPGGKVCVFTGIFKTLRNEDGLASVMGHEIAHAIARAYIVVYDDMYLAILNELGHSAEQMSISAALFPILLLLPPETFHLARLAFNLGVNLPFSRKHELEADAIGLDLMARACFDPRASPQMFEDWEKQHIGSSLTYFSTHPPNAERYTLLREKMKGPLTYYKQHCLDLQHHFRRHV
ncbi:hypothetical protein H257_18269 [Aphanomyces astaci]|uniref:Peptidase M48 domain-containing protein n=1 Tax=Aphanomyces astaci TaxID=112090 RepID=W4FDI6_APHAT|nr:hypothetical protein H257_18269 [Aphanomyces astaci]ETV64901.1 hypothetical protein H257_18269 [Aphanomyces astaci]|eukprot:XP_009845600.1 hypothetical protein H257_18269 [Aphanomyces astaci]